MCWTNTNVAWLLDEGGKMRIFKRAKAILSWEMYKLWNNMSDFYAPQRWWRHRHIQRAELIKKSDDLHRKNCVWQSAMAQIWWSTYPKWNFHIREKEWRVFVSCRVENMLIRSNIDECESFYLKITWRT